MKMSFVCTFFIFISIFSSIVFSVPIEITIEYPPTTCTENWQCTDWSSCINNTQTRTCADSNNCGTTYTKPAESQSCTCTESWSCTSWSECIGGAQTRSCSDTNNCNTTVYKPTESQMCTSGGQQGGGGGGSGGGGGGVVSGNVTITQPTSSIPPEPELKESIYLKIEISAPDQAEAGEPIIINVTLKSTTEPIATTVEILNEKRDIFLEANESKTLSFEVYTPETEGNYNLVAVTPYATGNKTIYLGYKPLFLYVTQIENQTYEIHLKNFDNTSTTELEIVKDNIQTVYLDSLKGKTDYKVNLTFSNTGEYVVKAKAVSGFNLLDEDTRVFKIQGKPEINYGLLILIVVLVIILIGSTLIFKELKR
jgi:hypothetical protein